MNQYSSRINTWHDVQIIFPKNFDFYMNSLTSKHPKHHNQVHWIKDIFLVLLKQDISGVPKILLT
jgi:hypothetical protein